MYPNIVLLVKGKMTISRTNEAAFRRSDQASYFQTSKYRLQKSCWFYLISTDSSFNFKPWNFDDSYIFTILKLVKLSVDIEEKHRNET